MKTIAIMLALALLFTGCAAVEVQGVEVNPEEPMTDDDGEELNAGEVGIAVVLGVLAGIGILAAIGAGGG